MKLLPPLLAVSLLANAAWLVTHITRDASDASANTSTTSTSAGASAATAAAQGNASTDASNDIVAALKANDTEALHKLLLAAGLPSTTIQTIVSSAVWSRYAERIKALQPKPDPNAPWWKSEADWFGSQMSREQRAEMRQLHRDANEEIRRLLGNDPSPWSNWNPRLAFLPESKRKEVQDIEQDYQDLIGEVQQEMHGFSLPSDIEKIRFLQEEKKRDLAALLSPQELADYELRMSTTAQQLRWKMSRFDATEEEYRKIFALQHAFDATQELDAWGNPVNQGPEGWKKRQEAEKQLKAQLKEALGAERYTDYVRSQNHEYQQLVTVAKRLDLPRESATQVFNLRYDVSAEATRIADNTSLTYEQKKQELSALARKTREQVRTTLGAEAAEIYLKNGMSWLSHFEHGNVVTFTEEGNHGGSRHIPRDTPKPQSSPAKP